MGTHVGPSVGESVTKMKSLSKKFMQKHDSNSNVNENWVTFINSRGWTGDKI